VGDVRTSGDQRVPAGSWLPLLAAWAGFLVPLGVFAALAEDVAEHEIFPFDGPVMLWLHSHATPAWTTLLQAVTQLGGPVAIPVVAVLLAAVLWRRGRHRDAGFLAASVLGSTGLNMALKAVFRRSRPDFWQHMVVENSYSFPSGHAMASASLAACCVVLAWHTRLRRVALVLAPLYVVAVGVSRMYLGVHYPSDVLAGWCVAVAWVVVVASVLGGTSAGLRARPARGRTGPDGSAPARRYPGKPSADPSDQ